MFSVARSPDGVHRDGYPTVSDEMQAVGGIILADEHLPASERPMGSCVEDLGDLLRETKTTAATP